MSKPLHLVDTMHGVLEDCYVQNMDFIFRFDDAPEVHILADTTKIKPWATELDISCYNIDPDSQGLLSNKNIKALGSNAVVLKGVYLLQDWSNISDNLNENTISLSIKINRDGIVNIKQMFYFDKTVSGDMGHANIINNIKGKIVFNRGGRSDIHRDNSIDVKIGRINFCVSDIKIDSLNYVFDMLDLPVDFNTNNVSIYRLYYHGRLLID